MVHNCPLQLTGKMLPNIHGNQTQRGQKPKKIKTIKGEDIYILIICKFIKTKQINTKGNLPYKQPQEKGEDCHKKSNRGGKSSAQILQFRVLQHYTFAGPT